MKIVPVKYLSSEWREYRRSRITGSTAAAILGLESGSYARSALTEWARLRGETPDREDSNPYSEWGLASEAVHRSWLQADGVGTVREVGGIVQHPEHDWACCTVDGLMGEGASLCVVELKAPSKWTADDWRSGLPLKYQVQSQFGMACCGAEQAYLSAILPPQKDPDGAFVRLAAALLDGTALTPDLLRWCGFEQFGHFLARDPRFQAAMFDKLRRFMEENVRGGFAPEASGLACDKEYLKNRVTGEPLSTEFDEEAVQKWEALEKVNAAMKPLSARKSELENQLTQAANAHTWAEAKKAIQAARKGL